MSLCIYVENLNENARLASAEMLNTMLLILKIAC